MPTYKNSFRAPEFEEVVIVEHNEDDDSTAIIGHLRVKPSSVMWKPTGAHKYHRVSLKKFTDWITSEDANAKLVKK